MSNMNSEFTMGIFCFWLVFKMLKKKKIQVNYQKGYIEQTRTYIIGQMEIVQYNMILEKLAISSYISFYS